MKTWIASTVTLLNCVVIITHIAALVLLITTKEKKISKGQKYLIISLCLTEMVYVITDNVYKILDLLKLENIAHNFWLITAGPIFFMYMFIMIFITIDRFLVFYLNLKYALYWSDKSMQLILTGLACISVISYIPLRARGINHDELGKTLACYIYPPFEVVFIFIVLLTYGYIFGQYRKSVRGDSYRRNILSHNRFKIKVPTLIILTYVICTIVPNVIRLLHFLIAIKIYDIKILHVLTPLGFLTDSAIYIYSIKTVRKNLKMSVRNFSRRK